MPPKLSIVIPAYNEQDRIRPTLEQYAAHFGGVYGDGFEIVIVLNGCRDNTRGVVDQAARSAPQIRAVEFAQPLGKGGAIREGLDHAKGELLAYADADNMVPADEVGRLVQALDTHDVAIANRFAGTQLEGGGQPLARRLISVLSRQWVRRYLGLPYADTQCGAKALRAAVWRDVGPRIRERGWAFDLDLLAHVHRRRLSVAEVPVRWRHVAEGSKVQAWRAVPEAFVATFRIRQNVGRKMQH